MSWKYSPLCLALVVGLVLGLAGCGKQEAKQVEPGDKKVEPRDKGGGPRTVPPKQTRAAE
jgi:hypothetical protein